MFRNKRVARGCLGEKYGYFEIICAALHEASIMGRSLQDSSMQRAVAMYCTSSPAKAGQGGTSGDDESVKASKRTFDDHILDSLLLRAALTASLALLPQLG